MKEDEKLGPTTNFLPFNVLAAHFLGVDHCGHIFGMENIKMKEKLLEMNDVLHESFSEGNCPPNTMFLVFGDHGQNENGDHGGDSDVEVNSALFVHLCETKKAKFPFGNVFSKAKPENNKEFLEITKKFSELEAKLEKAQAREFHGIEKNFQKTEYPFVAPIHEAKNEKFTISAIKQIDIVPTLSYLLKIPIPFGNLGRIIPEIASLRDLFQTEEQVKQFSVFEDSETKPDHLFYKKLWEIVISLKLNAIQIENYISAYTKEVPSFFSDKKAKQRANHWIQTANSEFSKIEQFIERKNKSKEQIPEEELKNLIESCYISFTLFLSTIHKNCELEWARFNVFKMILGITFMIFALIVVILTNFCNFEEKASKFQQIFEKIDLELIIFALILLFHTILGPTSNSYVIFEDRITFSIIGLFTCIFIFKRMKIFTSPAQKNQNPKQISAKFFKILLYLSIFLLGLRFSAEKLRLRRHATYQIINREPPAFNIYFVIIFYLIPFSLYFAHYFRTAITIFSKYSTLDHQQNKKKNRTKEFVTYTLLLISIISITALFGYYFVNLKFLNQNNEQNGNESTKKEINEGMPEIKIFAKPDNKKVEGTEKNLTPLQKFANYLNIRFPRVVYYDFFISTTIISIFYVSKLISHLKFSKSPSFAQEIRFTKVVFQVFSSIFIHLLIPVILLKGNSYFSIFFCLFAQILAFFSLISLIFSKNSKNSSTFLYYYITIIWWLISKQYYFALGQQNTFNTIQWPSSVIGLKEAQLVISGILTITTVFSTKIVFTFTLPLIISFTFLCFFKKYSKFDQSFTEILFNNSILFWILEIFTLIGSVVAVSIHRRHLMVWGIFAPKFIFDALSFVIESLLILINLCVVFAGLWGSQYLMRRINLRRMLKTTSEKQK